MALIVVAAFLVPGPALWKGFFSLATLSSVGVFSIFFLYGLKVQRQVFVDGFRNYRLHLIVQLTTFVVFPLLVLPFGLLTQSPVQHNLWLGALFLAALPSTLSTSVVMVSMAKGNIAAAIFNASLSGMLGVVLTPLWMSLFMNLQNDGLELNTVIIRLMVEIILPVCLGLALQNRLGWIPVKFSKFMGVFDKGVVLLIVYRSFAASFHNNLFAQTGIKELLLLIVAMTVLLLVVYFLISKVSKILKMSIPDQTTAQICGTQKSLIHGSVFANVLFGHMQQSGILILPLMIFHTLQILFFSVTSNNRSIKNIE